MSLSLFDKKGYPFTYASLMRKDLCKRANKYRDRPVYYIYYNIHSSLSQEHIIFLSKMSLPLFRLIRDR